MRRLILCGLLVLCILPLSCSQKECEWREIAKFANYEVQNIQDLAFVVVSGDTTVTEPFSAHKRKLQIFSVSSCSSSGILTIDLYHYPDMRFVKTVADGIWTGNQSEGPRKGFCLAEAEKGMYCLSVSSSPSVTWAVTVSECV
ncbi:MAG: hypothetical protein QUS33_08175 [Dehalococcoidia bacterium]|nr:hypothetical protein [Dehalococcoidia bacterium]